MRKLLLIAALALLLMPLAANAQSAIACTSAHAPVVQLSAAKLFLRRPGMNLHQGCNYHNRCPSRCATCTSRQCYCSYCCIAIQPRQR